MKGWERAKEEQGEARAVWVWWPGYAGRAGRREGEKTKAASYLTDQPLSFSRSHADQLARRSRAPRPQAHVTLHLAKCSASWIFMSLMVNPNYLLVCIR